MHAILHSIAHVTDDATIRQPAGTADRITWERCVDGVWTALPECAYPIARAEELERHTQAVRAARRGRQHWPANLSTFAEDPE